MLRRFEEMKERYEELERLIADPAAASSPKYPGHLREQGRLAKYVLPYRECLAVEQEIEEARDLAEGTDEELAELAREEIPDLEARAAGLREQLDELLHEQEEGTDRDVILEIRAGTGGQEAALFAADLFRMYRRYCETKGFKLQVLDASEVDMGGFKEITFEVAGEGAYGRFLFEGGTHRVQRVPKTESQGRIHTSAATVAVMPKADEVDIKIDQADLEISFTHSQGPGGQSVNTTDSAVRIVHKPTGEWVKCQVAKSQHQNRVLAMDILRARLLETAQREQEEKLGANRRKQIGSGDRSGRIRTYNFPQNRVTDHRLTGSKNFSLQKVIDGDLDGVIDRLAEELGSAPAGEGGQSE